MPITVVRGDIFLTASQALAIGLNAAGRLEVAPVYTALHDRFPVFVADYHKRGRAGQLAPGGVWVWPESQPQLMGLVVRETPQGAARLRFVEAALLNLVRACERSALRSLALLQPGDEPDWPAIRHLVTQHLGPLPLPVTFYEPHIPGLPAESGGSDPQGG